MDFTFYPFDFQTETHFCVSSIQIHPSPIAVQSIQKPICELWISTWMVKVVVADVWRQSGGVPVHSTMWKNQHVKEIVGVLLPTKLMQQLTKHKHANTNGNKISYVVLNLHFFLFCFVFAVRQKWGSMAPFFIFTNYWGRYLTLWPWALFALWCSLVLDR